MGYAALRDMESFVNDSIVLRKKKQALVSIECPKCDKTINIEFNKCPYCNTELSALQMDEQ